MKDFWLFALQAELTKNGRTGYSFQKEVPRSVSLYGSDNTQPGYRVENSLFKRFASISCCSQYLL
jgi:hypothetical protein